MATKYLQSINRGKKIEVLPDMRLRVTVRLDAVDIQQVAGDAAKFATNVVIPWGTAEEDFPQCLLIHQDDFGQTENPNKSPNDPPAYIIRVYEELSPDGETQVGEPSITYDQDNILEVSIDYLALTTSTPTYQVPGTTAAPAPFTSAILKEEIRTNDGTLQRIRRNYIASGTLSDVSEIRFGGKVIVRTITTIGATPPATPSGYTLVGPGVLHPDGREIWTYQFVAGGGGGGTGTGGVISQDIDYLISPDQGTTGVTRITIKQVSDLSVIVNPIASPGVGYELISSDYSAESGFKLWTSIYAKGTGLVADDKNLQNNGKLVIYSRTALNAVPATPAATIGGTVTLIQDDVRNGSDPTNGTLVYERKWAEGVGEISRDITYDQSSDQGTTGVTRTVIRYLVAPGATIQPTSLAGSVLIGQEYSDQDGYGIWTTRWAKGTGLVLDESTIQQSAALVVYHRVALGGAPATPTATIGGTVALFESSVRKDAGYDVYDYRWAEGDGQSSITTDGEADGALNYTVVTTSAAASTPAYPGSGTAYLIRLTQQPKNGYFENTAVYKKPPVSQTFKKTTNFTKPGNATISGSPPQLVYNSPVTMTVLADVVVDYGTTQITDAPFTVSAYATLYESWTPTATGIPQSRTSALGGYLAGASGTSGTNSEYNGVLCDAWAYQLGSSTPSSFTAAVHVLHTENDPYLVATDGTVVYRRTKISYDFS